MTGGPLNNVTEQDLETGYGGQMSRPEDLLAFPQPDRPYARPKEELGMTLRDWLAGMVASGIGNPKDMEFAWDETKAQGVARWSYRVADALLAERAKPPIEPETEPVEVPDADPSN